MPETKDEDKLDFSQVREEERAQIQKARSSSRDKTPASAGLAALCLSGGGIRSATFGLGVLQGLARAGLLKKLDYLSTVSGGGYIGSWLSAWIHRKGIDQVEEALAWHGPRNSPNDPTPIRHLRDFSNYLNPRLGLLSADTWTLVATYLRNLILNWLVLVPILVAAVMIPRDCIANITADSFEWLVAPLFVLGFLCRVMGIGFVTRHTPSNDVNGGDRKLGGAGQGTFLLLCWIPLLLSGILFTTVWAWGTSDKYECPYLPGLKEYIRPYPCVSWMVAIWAFNMCGWAFGTPWRWVAGAINNAKGSQEKKSKLLQFGCATVASAVEGGLLCWVSKMKYMQSGDFPSVFVCLALPAYLLALFLSMTLFTGIFSLRSSDEDREWWARFSGWMLIPAFGWVVVSALTLFGPLLLNAAYKSFWSAGGVTGLVTLLLGKSGGTSAREDSRATEALTDRLKKWALTLAAPVFTAFLLVVIAMAIGTIFKEDPDTNGTKLCFLLAKAGHGEWGPGWIAGSIVVLIVTSLMFSLLIDCNRFSLHGLYRHRLIRAYLGASTIERKSNCFTGFDPEDNLRMHELGPQGCPPSSQPLQLPLHVINAALNLVSGEQLAWQQRKAASFTFSPLHCGYTAEHEAYRRSKVYGGPDRGEGNTGASIGTAFTISGAAVSPNMGYHSSPAIAFLLTLFNVRLGWWLGNPANKRKWVYQATSPFCSVIWLLAEAFGLTNESSPYIYLSDGGHFENLGLYEMLRRRCRNIIVSDAGCDPDFEFEDLGNAVRKARIDLGVEIEFQRGIHIRPRNDKDKSPEPGAYCAVGRIRYPSDGADKEKRGRIVYLKPAFYGNEPSDILSYAAQSKTFPHETTGDQWFSESQFEGYRKLGLYAVSEITGIAGDGVKQGISVREFFARSKCHAKKNSK